MNQPNQTPELLDLSEVRIDPAWALRVPPALAVRKQVLAFSLVNDQVCIAHARPVDPGCASALQKHLRKPLRFFLAEPNSLRDNLNRIYSNLPETATRLNGEDAETSVSLCDELLNAAMMQQASDLHIDPGLTETLIRLRVDGVLRDYRPLPASAQAGLISRFKVMAGMDIAEKRAPQDGRFRHELSADRRIDIRVASLPTRHGERMTLRFLSAQTESLTLERLGMQAEDLERVNAAINKPHGLILITGPTGSGKSTTL